MKIVIDSDIPFVRGVLEPYASVAYVPGARIGRHDAADADALVVRTRTRCDRALLHGSRVSLIATATIGFDHIDMAYCADAGIEVAAAAGSNARGVLQWVGAALAGAARATGRGPEGRTIGVVGVGSTGGLVARYAASWGMEVLCCDLPRARREGAAAGFVTLDEIASRCDIVSFHVPLTRDGEDATLGMAGRDFFHTLAPGALILNSSRGEVVDTAALKEAIRDRAFTACIDTWENEPHIDRELLAAALLGTPHIAGYTLQGKANAAAMAVHAVARRFGLPLNGWYPCEVTPTAPRAISWEEMTGSIGRYFDIGAQSRALKEAPGRFEAMRDNYVYREEYF